MHLADDRRLDANRWMNLTLLFFRHVVYSVATWCLRREQSSKFDVVRSLYRCAAYRKCRRLSNELIEIHVRILCGEWIHSDSLSLSLSASYLESYIRSCSKTSHKEWKAIGKNISCPGTTRVSCVRECGWCWRSHWHVNDKSCGTQRHKNRCCVCHQPPLIEWLPAHAPPFPLRTCARHIQYHSRGIPILCFFMFSIFEIFVFRHSRDSHLLLLLVCSLLVI